MKTSIALVVVLAVNVGYLIGDFVGSRQSDTYRANAMDLCAWHARSIYLREDPSDTVRWREVANGTRRCPFCGQKHDDDGWVSRNGWDSQVEAMMKSQPR